MVRVLASTRVLEYLLRAYSDLISSEFSTRMCTLVSSVLIYFQAIKIWSKNKFDFYFYARAIYIYIYMRVYARKYMYTSQDFFKNKNRMCTHVCKLRCTHIASSSGVCTLRRTHTRRARAVVLTGMPACKHTHHPENPGFRSYKFTLLLGVLHRSMHMVHCSFKSVDARPRQLSRVPSYDSSTVLIDTAPPSNPVY